MWDIEKVMIYWIWLSYLYGCIIFVSEVRNIVYVSITNAFTYEEHPLGKTVNLDDWLGKAHSS